MPSNKISISFSEHYIDIYNYLIKKENISNFICQLVKSEMTSKDTYNLELQNQIEKIIEKILKNKNFSINNDIQSVTNTNSLNLLSDDDKSLIKDLF